MSESYWLRLERSHTLGSSLQLGLVARLGLVAGGDAQVGGDEAGAELCAGGGCAGCWPGGGGNGVGGGDGRVGEHANTHIDLQDASS